MALKIILSKIEAPGNLIAVQPTLSGTSTFTVHVAGVTREFTVVFAGS